MGLSEEELLAAADELLAEVPQLPSPAERARLREAAGITQARLAAALKTTTQTIKNWENGRSEPRSPRLEAYQRILSGWAAKHPTHGTPTAAPAPAPQPQAPAAFTRPATPAARAEPVTPLPAPAAASAPEHPIESGRPATRFAPSRLPTVDKAAPAVFDPRFPSGPLAVLDGDGTAYGIGGIVLDCPATTIVELVEWTLTQSGLGAPKLHRYGMDSDPLIVLTATAAAKFGLPERLEDRRGLRLPEDHPVVKQVTKAKWQLTQRGFGPWARIYRKAQGRDRQCVQLALLPWDALDSRSWPGVNEAEMHPADIARVLGIYAQRVITPRGSTAVSGLELMTALRPPTRPVRDEETGNWTRGHHAGSLGTDPLPPAPPEARPEHPVVVSSGWTGGFVNEEAYQWIRDIDLLTGDEAALPYAVGLDLNTAFLASTARLMVGLCEPDHFVRPKFYPKVTGSWLVDLSHIDLDPRLPSPFTLTGQRPTGPAWYQTHTVAYAQELGYNVDVLEAYLRRETGAYLDPWHDRLKTAYAETLADLGVTPDLTDPEFLAAMEVHKQVDPAMAAVLTAIKATVKGGIGKLFEGPQGTGYKDGEEWPAMKRPTWAPWIRNAIISKTRVNMHRKLANMAKLTGMYPLAVLSDCVVYPATSTSPLDFLPYAESGKPIPGAFRLGPTPGRAKLEGAQPMTWAVDLMEQGYNPARHIKGDGHDAVMDEGE
ncbi:helix-turn-helix domain-containing protein [Streptomyces sp. NBC_01077]|uniref:telomere-associated protein Tap n=1 Tax=Streptomyces sp. NBC_01077 TaxID=2903746 RepID=UPI00386F9CF8|nr:helix-turn-helix domain-containing protein [Streptomyces sp. NBC_01077]WSV43434.1 helix-turn-helix domain-containing protein [Streptomyces sp. NBC_01077]